IDVDDAGAIRDFASRGVGRVVPAPICCELWLIGVLTATTRRAREYNAKAQSAFEHRCQDLNIAVRPLRPALPASLSAASRADARSLSGSRRLRLNHRFTLRAR